MSSLYAGNAERSTVQDYLYSVYSIMKLPGAFNGWLSQC